MDTLLLSSHTLGFVLVQRPFHKDQGAFAEVAGAGFREWAPDKYRVPVGALLEFLFIVFPCAVGGNLEPGVRTAVF